VLRAQATGQALTHAELEATVLAELRLPATALDETEIEDARWFHAAWLRRQLSHAGALALPLLLPPPAARACMQLAGALLSHVPCKAERRPAIIMVGLI
jgi:hypothetical protein